jgi:hypothetical protein
MSAGLRSVSDNAKKTVNFKKAISVNSSNFWRTFKKKQAAYTVV